MKDLETFVNSQFDKLDKLTGLRQPLSKIIEINLVKQHLNDLFGQLYDIEKE